LPPAPTISGTWANSGGSRSSAVVHDHREVVERIAVAATNDAVADLAGILAARAEHEVVPVEPALFGKAEADGVGAAVGAEIEIAAAPVVGPLAAGGDRLALSLLDLLGGATTAVGAPGGQQILDDAVVPIPSLALSERPLVPSDP
jgi:hypothetical protein